MSAATLDFFPIQSDADRMTDAQLDQWCHGFVIDTTEILRYVHGMSAHAELMATVDTWGFKILVVAALRHEDGMTPSWESVDGFLAGVRQQARRAWAAGLVVADGKSRARPRGCVGQGELFAGVGK